ncbi:MAG: T9SS type A sorting domain-containing protein [Bacteroidales bacterium]|nr:T9SS type A sorting domain-containing protein [Bacteroidales bacterium]
MYKSILYTALFLGLAVLTGSWGSSGHRIISTNASLSFNQQMHEFHEWTEFLADHASDADWRKDEDPDEAPKHYIDMDSYYSFILLHRIPQTFDSVISMYGSAFVYDNGILPWATESTFNSLQSAFESGNFDQAKILAADLGHYVGDGHMPMHITKNYDGQYTGNNGIHSRYESSMVNAFDDQIIYSGDSISHIENVNGYIFNYLYHNYQYIDSILLADNYAKDLTGSTSSSAYKNALWDKTGNFTIQLMKEASHALTELIYTAWVNAGSPAVGPSAIKENNKAYPALITSVTEDYSSNNTVIRYSVSKPTQLKMSITDIYGKPLYQVDNTFAVPGNHVKQWSSGEMSSGVYVLILQTPTSKDTKKFVYTR